MIGDVNVLYLGVLKMCFYRHEIPGLSELMNTNSKKIPIKFGDTRNISHKIRGGDQLVELDINVALK
jgi:hypothetical protein